VIALAILGRSVPESRDENAAPGLDYAGVILSALAAFALLFGCTEGQALGFGDPLVIGSLVAAAVLAVAFVVVERRIRNPLIDLRLFRSRPFDGALVANTIMNIVFAGLSFLLTLYLQDVRGYSPMTAGLLLLPSTATILLLNPVGQRVAARVGPKLPVVLGTAILGVGTVVAGLIGRSYSYGLLLTGLLVLGAGIGLLSTPLSDTAVAGPPEELAGTASGTFKMTSMIGGALGVALMVAVSQGLQTDLATQRATAAGLDQKQVDTLADAIVNSDVANQVLASVTAQQKQELLAAYRSVEALGISGAIKAAGIFALVGALLLIWVWKRARRTAD